MMLLQISVEGFNEAAEISPLFGILVSTTVILTGAVIYLFRLVSDKNKEVLKLQYKSSEKIEVITNAHIERLEAIRVQVLSDDRIRSKDSAETEREILSILNSLTKILELGDEKSKAERIIILDKLNDINRKLNTTIEALINKK